MFISDQFTIAKTWKQPKCPSTKDWIKKLWDMHTMEYYTAVKRDEIWSFATKWNKLENLIFSEITQSQRDKHHMFCMTWEN